MNRDEELIDAFAQAARKVLSIQAGIEPVMIGVCVRPAKVTLSRDVSGIIGVVAEQFNGIMVISFSEATFLAVMSGMLGEKLTELTQELIDGAGELTNMIFGQAKVTLNEKGHALQMAIPTVMSGKNHSFMPAGKSRGVLIEFTSPAGDFFLEICLDS